MGNDYCSLDGDKEKMYGTKQICNYTTMIYGGVSVGQRAVSGVAVCVNATWKNKIVDKIITVRFRI